MTEQPKTGQRDLRQEITMLLDGEICEMANCSPWTLRQWRQKHGFPRPIFVTDGSPGRTPIARILRWFDSRERRRRRVIRRGRLKRGDRLVDAGGEG